MTGVPSLYAERCAAACLRQAGLRLRHVNPASRPTFHFLFGDRERRTLRDHPSLHVSLYLLIFWHVRASRQQAGSRRHRKSRTNRMLAAVVLVFAVAWTPYQLFSVVSEFDAERVSGPYFRFVDLTLRVVAMGSSGVNPFLYGWMNANFRAAFATILRRRRLPTGAGTANHRGGGGGGGAVTEADEFCTPNVERRVIVMQRQRGDDDDEAAAAAAARQHLALCHQFEATSALSVAAIADVHEEIEVAV